MIPLASVLVNNKELVGSGYYEVLVGLGFINSYELGKPGLHYSSINSLLRDLSNPCLCI